MPTTTVGGGALETSRRELVENIFPLVLGPSLLHKNRAVKIDRGGPVVYRSRGFRGIVSCATHSIEV